MSVITHIHDSVNGINEQNARSVLQYDGNYSMPQGEKGIFFQI